MTDSQRRDETPRLLHADEIAGPGEDTVHPLIANYLVACFKFALNRPDVDDFAEKLLNELEGRTHVL